MLVSPAVDTRAWGNDAKNRLIGSDNMFSNWLT